MYLIPPRLSTSRSRSVWPFSPPSKLRSSTSTTPCSSGGSIPPRYLILAFLKFVIVIGWYMHLRYEKTVVSRFFVFGFMLALTLYAVVLIGFGVLAAKA